jgi:phage gp36-like protein
MAYLTSAELLDYGTDELVDVDADLVTARLAWASELIDNMLRGGVYAYTLPINPAPAIIKQICADLARASIASGLRVWETERLEALERRERLALSLLVDIAAGKIKLDPALLSVAAAVPTIVDDPHVERGF